MRESSLNNIPLLRGNILKSYKQNTTVIIYRLRIDIPTSDCTVKSHDCGKGIYRIADLVAIRHMPNSFASAAVIRASQATAIDSIDEKRISLSLFFFLPVLVSYSGGSSLISKNLFSSSPSDYLLCSMLHNHLNILKYIDKHLLCSF